MRFLQQQDFPAEKLAQDEITILQGRSLLLTHYIKGTKTEPGPVLYSIATLLGRLHRLSIDEAICNRSAGALHHYCVAEGGIQNEINEATVWMEQLKSSCPPESSAVHRSLVERVQKLNNLEGLPTSLIHPDPVLKNTVMSDNGPVFIDWTGTGRGPRVLSFAMLLLSSAFIKSGFSVRRINAVVAGYRSQIQLEEKELELLPAALKHRPAIFACYRFKQEILGNKVPNGGEWWLPDDKIFDGVAQKACESFRIPLKQLIEEIKAAKAASKGDKE